MKLARVAAYLAALAASCAHAGINGNDTLPQLAVSVQAPQSGGGGGGGGG